MTTGATNIGNSGSRWLRWDPHFHAPGTALNDQFGREDGDFDAYLRKIETSAPTIRAVGIQHGTVQGYIELRACCFLLAVRNHSIGKTLSIQ